jgi:restriction system protein
MIKVGDLVALPLKHRPAVAFGEVIGPYQYNPEAPEEAMHQLPVKWITEVPRAKISQDLRFTLGAFLTVCKVERNDAETRFRALVQGKPDPLLSGVTKASIDDSPETEVTVDLEEASLTRIQDVIYAKFKGHAMARLVGAVLTAQGYQGTVSPEGADGGVDVIAGSGSLGFGSPRLVVQVKSDQAPVDVKIVRELQGVMKQFGADHGMVVAWGGFKTSVTRETARQFFEIRLWTGTDLVENVLNYYELLPAEIRAELPLKRIWTVAGLDEEI